MVAVDPLLSNPPGFVLLAIVFALAAYLRQIGENRERLLDEIQGNKVWTFPLGETHTDLKIRRLQSSKSVLGWIARVVVVFTIFIAFRFLMLAYARYRFSDDPAHYARLFRIFDCLALLVIFVLVFVLGVIHELGRHRDRQIGHAMASWRERYLTSKENA